MPIATTNLATLLNDPDLLRSQSYVAGQWIDANDGATFPVTNPARGDIIANVADLTRTETARAIDAAHLVQKEWSSRTGKEKAAILRRWYDLMVANADPHRRNGQTPGGSTWRNPLWRCLC
jgi:succinate-semialdehyde dehydrogenase / glutarate-semialdehyde dehydrogenase